MQITRGGIDNNHGHDNNYDNCDDNYGHDDDRNDDHLYADN